MAIVITKDDSILDLLKKLQSNNFEIFAIEYGKLKDYFRVIITWNNRFVKVINDGSHLLIFSDCARCIYANKVLINDDLSFEAIK